jgi:N-acetylmuramoyl-L-alanine amidase
LLKKPSEFKQVKNEVRIPWAVQDVAGIKYKTYGKYATKSGWPCGIVIHFPASRGAWSATAAIAEAQAIKLIKYLDSQKYATLSIDTFGKLYQNSDLNQYGAHAGTSSWKNMTSLNKWMLGVDIPSAGRLTKVGDKYFTWYKEEVPVENVIYSPKKDSIVEGYYEKCPPKAIETLFKLLVWLCKNNDEFKVENIIGHEEATTRKNDPGPIVNGMSCKEIRAHVQALLDDEKNFTDMASFNDHIDSTLV